MKIKIDKHREFQHVHDEQNDVEIQLSKTYLISKIDIDFIKANKPIKFGYSFISEHSDQSHSDKYNARISCSQGNHHGGVSGIILWTKLNRFQKFRLNWMFGKTYFQNNYKWIIGTTIAIIGIIVSYWVGKNSN